MGNLIKYELRGRSRYILGAIAIIVIFNTCLILKGRSYTAAGMDPYALIFALSGMCLAASPIVCFIYLINSFRRDIIGDTGYLLFTTPRSSYSILGSKVVTALIEYLIFTVVPTLMLILNVLIIATAVPGGVETLKQVFQVGWSYRGTLIFGYILAGMLFTQVLLLIYFSIVLSKSLLKTNRFGKLISFIIFILTVILITKVDSVLVNTFPQTFSFNFGVTKLPFKVVDINGINLNANIASTVFKIVIYVASFIGTGYLMENKMDL